MKEKKKGLFLKWFLVIFIVAGMMYTPAWAQPKIKLALDHSFTFDSNPALKDKEWDYENWGLVSTISPAITVGLPTPKTYSEVGYRAGYANTFGDKETWNSFTHKAFGVTRLDLTPRASIGISDSFDIQEVPETDGETLLINTMNVSGRAQLGSKITLNSGYTYQFFDDRSEKNDFSQYGNHGFTAGIGYMLTPRINVSIDGSYNTRDFGAEIKDYQSYGGRVGAGLTLGSKSDISGNIGFEHRSYDESKDISSIIGGARFNLRMTNKTSFAVAYDYKLEDTYVIRTNRAEDLLQPSVISLYPLDNLERFYTVINTHRVTPSFTIRLTEKDTVNLAGAYQFSSSDDKYYQGTAGLGSLDEHTYEAGIGVSHAFNKYLSVGVTASIGQRFSDERGDYVYNAGGVNVRLAF